MLLWTVVSPVAGYTAYADIPKDIRECEAFMSASTPAQATLSAIFAKYQVGDCAALANVARVKSIFDAPRPGIFRVAQQKPEEEYLLAEKLDLSELKINDLSPLSLFFVCGNLDIAGNDLSDEELLRLEAVDVCESTKIDISANRVSNSKVIISLLKNFNHVTANNTAIADPENLPWTAPKLQRTFPIREEDDEEIPFESPVLINGNVSKRGESFDRVLPVIANYYQVMTGIVDFTPDELLEVGPFYAEQVEKFDSLRNVSADEVLTALEIKYRDKRSPRFYFLPQTLKVNDSPARTRSGHIEATFIIARSLGYPDASVVHPKIGQKPEIDRFYEFAVEEQKFFEVELRFNSDLQIVSHAESEIENRLKVTAPTLIFPSLEKLVSCIKTEEELVEPACEKHLPKISTGKLLTGDGMVLNKFVDSGRGQYSFHAAFRRAKLDGKTIWVLDNRTEWNKPGPMCACADFGEDPGCRGVPQKEAEADCAQARDSDVKHIEIQLPNS